MHSKSLFGVCVSYSGCNWNEQGFDGGIPFRDDMRHAVGFEPLFVVHCTLHKNC